jgi:hypothetical protein
VYAPLPAALLVWCLARPSPCPAKNGEHDPQGCPRADIGGLLQEGARDVGKPAVGDLQEELMLVTVAATVDAGPPEGLEFTQSVAGSLIGKATRVLDVLPRKPALSVDPLGFLRFIAEGLPNQGQKTPECRVGHLRHLCKHHVRDGNAEEARGERLGGIQEQLIWRKLTGGIWPVFRPRRTVRWVWLL